jgi:hypothetical protein
MGKKNPAMKNIANWSFEAVCDVAGKKNSFKKISTLMLLVHREKFW